MKAPPGACKSPLMFSVLKAWGQTLPDSHPMSNTRTTTMCSAPAGQPREQSSSLHQREENGQDQKIRRPSVLLFPAEIPPWLCQDLLPAPPSLFGEVEGLNEKVFLGKYALAVESEQFNIKYTQPRQRGKAVPNYECKDFSVP